MGSIGEVLAQTTRGGAAFVNSLVQDLDAADMNVTSVEGMNHPAFILGHVAYYIDYVLTILGRDDLSESIENGDALFAMGVECVDGGDYPDKDTLLAWFNGRCEAAASLFESTNDEELMRPNEGGPLAEHLTTIGAEVMFICHGHAMFHLGQLSAWRRARGIPRTF